MDELIARVSQAAGVDPELAEKAIGEIFAYLKAEVSREEVQKLFDKLPGANELADSRAKPAASISNNSLLSSLRGLMGGGVMGLASKLMGLGLNTGEMQKLAHEVINYAREEAGDQIVNDIIDLVPPFRQFM
jgi:hypothetical protein